MTKTKSRTEYARTTQRAARLIALAHLVRDGVLAGLTTGQIARAMGNHRITTHYDLRNASQLAEQVAEIEKTVRERLGRTGWPTPTQVDHK